MLLIGSSGSFTLSTMQLGLSTYTYTWAIGVPGSIPAQPLTAYGLIDLAASNGLHLVQLADNISLANFSDEELNLLSEYAKNKGIAIEPGGRCLSPENFDRYISIAEIFGSPILRFVIDGPGFEPSVDEVAAIILPQIGRLRALGIRLAIENHDRLHCDEFLEIIRKTDSEMVGICLDTVNSMGASEGLHEVVSALAPCTINLHIKDYSVHRIWHKMGFAVEGTPAGAGMLNIPWLLGQIEPHGRCHTALLELWTPPGVNLNETIEKEAQWASESIAYLKTLNFK